MLGVAGSDLIGREIAPTLGVHLGEPATDAHGAIRFPNPTRIRLTRQGDERVVDLITHLHDDVLICEVEDPAQVSPVVAISQAAIDPYFDVVRQAIQGASTAPDVEAACQTVAELARAFTGFDRVMIYRFLSDDSGEVVAESRDAAVDSYLGLRFPESDIPAQARRLYAINPLRLIPDAAYEPAPIAPQLNPRTGRPLDLTHAVLRSVSPVHRRYLANMGVRASMSISLLDGERLWGMIACHHRRPRFVSYGARAALEVVGATLSTQIQLIERRDVVGRLLLARSIASELMNDLARSESLAEGMRQQQRRVLSVFDAGGMALSYDGTLTLCGDTPDATIVDRTLDRLQSHPEDIFATDRLHTLMEEPDDNAGVSDGPAGVLRIRFSRGSKDALLLFRSATPTSIRWAGRAEDARFESGALHPRASFATWVESVRGCATPWTESDIDLAREFARGLKVLVINPAERLSQVNRQLEARNQELSHFAHTVTHDLKAPLVTIMGFGGETLEAIQRRDFEEAEACLQRVVNAGARMERTIEHVLSLTRYGRAIDDPVEIDLADLIEDIRLNLGDVENTASELLIDGALGAITGDINRIRTVFDNLISNAVKYAPGRVEIDREDIGDEVRIAVRDHGPGVPRAHRRRVFELFHRIHIDSAGSGVGLALVARIMAAHGGRSWVAETPGGGATFWVSFPKGPPTPGAKPT